MVTVAEKTAELCGGVARPGFITTLMHASRLSRNVRYIGGASPHGFRLWIGNGLDADTSRPFPSRRRACSGPQLWLSTRGNLTGFEPLLEVPEILADGPRRLTTEERRDQRSGLAGRVVRWIGVEPRASMCDFAKSTLRASARVSAPHLL